MVDRHTSGANRGDLVTVDLPNTLPLRHLYRNNRSSHNLFYVSLRPRQVIQLTIVMIGIKI